MSNEVESRNGIRLDRKRGLLFGLPLAILAVISLYPSQIAWLHASGPANVGHETIGCNDCHREAEGTFRQQLQAKVRYLVGLRVSDVAVGHLVVDNKVCITCHQRKSDDHPIDRFFEPRFDKILSELKVNACTGCHLEHTGRRVTMPLTDCKHCHDNLSLKKDPLDVPHATLVKEHRWETCLGCHDFHGNHVRETQKRIDERISVQKIEEYLAGIARSPYGSNRRYSATKNTGKGSP